MTIEAVTTGVQPINANAAENAAKTRWTLQCGFKVVEVKRGPSPAQRTL